MPIETTSAVVKTKADEGGGEKNMASPEGLYYPGDEDAGWGNGDGVENPLPDPEQAEQENND